MTTYPIPFGTIGPPWWNDRPVAIVGAGPSLRDFRYDRLRGPWHVVAVNQSIWPLRDIAHAAISIDIPWIRGQAAEAVKLGVPIYVAGPEHHQCPFVEDVTYLRRSRTTGFSERDDTIEMGGTSGYAALNFAFLKRAKSVVLFGFDYSTRRGDHADDTLYAWHPPGHNARYWPRWAQNFREVIPQITKAGMQVLNASPESTIDAFPKCSVDGGLAALATQATFAA